MYTLIGGIGGRNYHGMGGISYSAIPESVFAEGLNPGDGYVLIYPCRLECPPGSICRFTTWTENANMSCECENGLELDSNGNCTVCK